MVRALPPHAGDTVKHAGRSDRLQPEGICMIGGASREFVRAGVQAPAVHSIMRVQQSYSERDANHSAMPGRAVGDTTGNCAVLRRTLAPSRPTRATRRKKRVLQLASFPGTGMEVRVERVGGLLDRQAMNPDKQGQAF
jgi:hypothetical protein